MESKYFVVDTVKGKCYSCQFYTTANKVANAIDDSYGEIVAVIKRMKNKEDLSRSLDNFLLTNTWN